MGKFTTVKKATKKGKAKLRFYQFRQNNSGGSFVHDDKKGISVLVIVQAASPEEANYKAEDIGLYFDGVGDCSCCGARWSIQWSGEKGDAVPSYYGTPLTKLGTKADKLHLMKWRADGKPEIYIHYADGKIVGFQYDVKKKKGAK